MLEDGKVNQRIQGSSSEGSWVKRQELTSKTARKSSKKCRGWIVRGTWRDDSEVEGRARPSDWWKYSSSSQQKSTVGRAVSKQRSLQIKFIGDEKRDESNRDLSKYKIASTFIKKSFVGEIILEFKWTIWYSHDWKNQERARGSLS